MFSRWIWYGRYRWMYVAYERIAGSSRISRPVRLVSRHRGCNSQQRKTARRRLLNSTLMMDQTNLNAGFDLRRYAMKPTPAKPRIIMAHVEGSGTAGDMVAVQVP